jgi:MFS family permease
VLTVFTALLALALMVLLEESHPPARRTSFAPRPLLASYLSFSRDRPFWPLLISSSVNFAGLFLYIASAPRIVRELLHLSAAGFPWLFLPVVIGLVGGAWLSGRMAERCSARFTVNLGYAVMLLACCMHLLLALVFLRAAAAVVDVAADSAWHRCAAGISHADACCCWIAFPSAWQHFFGTGVCQPDPVQFRRRRAVAAAVGQHAAAGAGCIGLTVIGTLAWGGIAASARRSLDRMPVDVDAGTGNAGGNRRAALKRQRCWHRVWEISLRGRLLLAALVA